MLKEKKKRLEKSNLFKKKKLRWRGLLLLSLVGPCGMTGLIASISRHGRSY